MSNIAMNYANKYGKKYAADTMKKYEPVDPYYEFIVDGKGKRKRVKRDVPPGLSKRDEKALRKIRKRAHYLDKGMNLCGFRVGWTFWIGIIPGAGDVADVILNYTLVVRPATKLDLPGKVTSQMFFNNAISAGVGLVPLLGDVALAAWKANWRNAHLLEEFLRQRGLENLAAGQASGLTEFSDPQQAELAADAIGAVGQEHPDTAPLMTTSGNVKVATVPAAQAPMHAGGVQVQGYDAGPSGYDQAQAAMAQAQAHQAHQATPGAVEVQVPAPPEPAVTKKKFWQRK